MRIVWVSGAKLVRGKSGIQGGIFKELSLSSFRRREEAQGPCVSVCVNMWTEHGSVCEWVGILACTVSQCVNESVVCGCECDSMGMNMLMCVSSVWLSLWGSGHVWGVSVKTGVLVWISMCVYQCLCACEWVWEHMEMWNQCMQMGGRNWESLLMWMSLSTYAIVDHWCECICMWEYVSTCSSWLECL